MKLNDEGLKNRQWWEEKGYSLPKYDRKAIPFPNTIEKK